jgi:LuxR family maltose regulon positive regulatory protein
VPVLWFKLDHTDADWISFTNYLIAAYRELEPEFGHATLSLLDQLATADQSRDRIIDALLADIARFDHPALLILDDYHLVDRGADAREIVARLLREAPSSLSVLIASRRRPDLDLARPMAQGQVAELTTDDLRFSRAETDTLFSETYQQPLEPDVLDQVEQRTEGWAASLQLFRSSIRGRSALEIRAFTRAMSGTQGPIYDFLAQEVLRELTPNLRRFVVGSAILLRIVPSLVAAIFADDPEPPTLQTARGWIEAADDLGLMGRRGESGRGYRFHPLLREFLLRQLTEDVPAEAIRQRHHRVATAAETDDWLTACYHYLEAGEPAEAVRVMSDSLLVAIGTGAWGVAADLLDRFPTEPDAPAVQVILALRALRARDLVEAARRLDGIDLSATPSASRGLVRLSQMKLAWQLGDLERARRAYNEIAQDPESPVLIQSVASALHALGLLGFAQPLAETASQLQRLAGDSEKQGLGFFAAVSLHNLMEVERARGRFKEAYAAGERALGLYGEEGFGIGEAYGTHATLASCAGELGLFATMDEHLAAVQRATVIPPDAALEVAYLSTVLGASATADTLLESIRSEIPSGRVSPLATSTFILADARRAIGEDPARALAICHGVTLQGPGTQVTAASIAAMASLLSGSVAEAHDLAQSALQLAYQEGNGLWPSRLRVVLAAAARQPEALTQAIKDARAAGRLGLAEVAEVLVASLDVLPTVPGELLESVAELPQRWLPILRKQLGSGLTPNARQAAVVLDHCGSSDDVPLVTAFARKYLKGTGGSGVGKELVRRTSPMLRVHDLGNGTLSVGNRTTPIGRIRRKSASLLLYLIASPRQMATRERVLDELWPDLSPDAAANSLNQTLYFLRRDVDPWYEVGTSLEYVRYEGETLALDEDLVVTDSVTFHTDAVALSKDTSPDPEQLLATIDRYAGSFAPEFEYEDWAQDWRQQLAIAFLHLVDRARAQLVRSGNAGAALALTQRALALEPRNPELHRSLVALYLGAGSRSAAAEQYVRYATISREELGVEPDPLDRIEPDQRAPIRRSAY